MKKISYIIILACMLCFAPGMQTNTMARIELSEIESQQIRVDVNGASLTVYGAQGKVLHIYNLIGMEVMSVKIDANEKKVDISGLKKVVHLIKIGNISKKINLLSR